MQKHVTLSLVHWVDVLIICPRLGGWRWAWQLVVGMGRILFVLIRVIDVMIELRRVIDIPRLQGVMWVRTDVVVGLRSNLTVKQDVF